MIAIEVSMLKGDREHTRDLVAFDSSVDDGAMRIWCWECAGTGAWPYHPDGFTHVCTPCKGAGYQWVGLR